MAANCYTCRRLTYNPVICPTCSAVQYCSPSHLTSDSTRHHRECKILHHASVEVFRAEEYLLSVPAEHLDDPNLYKSNFPKYDDPEVSYSPCRNRQMLIKNYTSKPRLDIDPYYLTPESVESYIFCLYMTKRNLLVEALLQVEGSDLALRLVLENLSDMCVFDGRRIASRCVEYAIVALLRLGMDISAYEITMASFEMDKQELRYGWGVKIEPFEKITAILTRTVNRIDGRKGGCQCGLGGCRYGPRCSTAGEWVVRDGVEESRAQRLCRRETYTAYREIYVPWIFMMLIWVRDLKALGAFGKVEGWFVKRLNFDVVEIIKEYIVESEFLRRRNYLDRRDHSVLIEQLEDRMKYGFNVVNMGRGSIWPALDPKAKQRGFWDSVVEAAKFGVSNLIIRFGESFELPRTSETAPLLRLWWKLFRDTPGAIEYVEEQLAAAEESGMMRHRDKTLLEYYALINSGTQWPYPETSWESAMGAYRCFNSQHRLVYLLRPRML